ncbi:11332_t:CDS:2 [Entrophospora sp. SA101]|nr:11332_t:CDS:2 [Entrophospora sp. SA101]
MTYKKYINNQSAPNNNTSSSSSIPKIKSPIKKNGHVEKLKQIDKIGRNLISHKTRILNDVKSSLSNRGIYKKTSILTEKDILKEKHIKLQDDITRAHKQIESYTMENNRIKNDVKLKKAKLVESLEAISKIKENLLTTKEEIIKLNSQIMNSSQELEILNNSIKNDRDELISLKATKESIANELMMIETKIIERKNLIEHLNAECLKYENTRRYLHNVIQDLKGNIRVFCRVRPQTSAEKDDPLTEIKYPESYDNKKIVIGSVVKNYLRMSRNVYKEYEFDYVFKSDSTQEQVYAEIAHVVQSVVDGYNCCIFAYGQTGAGKTYTMQGSNTPESEGMITRAFRHIFSLVNELKSQGWNYTIEGQFIEIYNDNVYDLLKIPRGKFKDIKITHDIEKGSTRIANVKTVLESATKHRSVASTKMNNNSSRSHSIFMIHIEGLNLITNETRSGSLNLIDLAGSEKISTYDSTGDLQTETIYINKSLSSLKTVIQNIKESTSHINYRDSILTYVLKNSLGLNLITNETRSGSLNLIDLAGSEKISTYDSTGDLQTETIYINKSLSSLKTVIQNIKESTSHINYRDSILTYVLKNSLGGNAKVLMLVNISPIKSSQAETESSLEFGRVAKAAHIGIAKKVKT